MRATRSRLSRRDADRRRIARRGGAVEALAAAAEARIDEALEHSRCGARCPSPPTLGTTCLPDAARTLTYSEALNEALREEMVRDDDVFVMGRTSRSGETAAACSRLPGADTTVR